MARHANNRITDISDIVSNCPDFNSRVNNENMTAYNKMFDIVINNRFMSLHKILLPHKTRHHTLVQHIINTL